MKSGVFVTFLCLYMSWTCSAFEGTRVPFGVSLVESYATVLNNTPNSFTIWNLSASHVQEVVPSASATVIDNRCTLRTSCIEGIDIYDRHYIQCVKIQDYGCFFPHNQAMDDNPTVIPNVRKAYRWTRAKYSRVVSIFLKKSILRQLMPLLKPYVAVIPLQLQIKPPIVDAAGLSFCVQCWFHLHSDPNGGIMLGCEVFVPLVYICCFVFILYYICLKIYFHIEVPIAILVENDAEPIVVDSVELPSTRRLALQCWRTLSMSDISLTTHLYQNGNDVETFRPLGTPVHTEEEYDWAYDIIN